MPVMTAKKLRKRKMRESRRTAWGGRGSREGWRRIGISDTKEVRRGRRAFKRRYRGEEEGSIELAARVYKAALTPLKLTVREIARGRFAGKF